MSSSNAPREFLTQTVIDAISARLALIGDDGTILAVNRAWQESAAADDAADRAGVGVNYLAICRAASDPAAARVGAAIGRVIGGFAVHESIEYAQPGTGNRCYVVDVSRLDAGVAMVAHTDVTARVEATTALAETNRHVDDRVASRTADLRALTSKLLRMHESERKRLARDIHDELGQSLTELNLRVAALRGVDERPELLRQLDDLGAAVRRATKSVQRLASDLRPALLDRMGLVEAVQAHVAHFRDRTGIDASFRSDEGLQLRGECGTAVYRVLQEALLNVARHARASRVRVHLRRTPTLVLTVRDNGVGFDAKHAIGAGSLGLLGMQERAHMVGGDLRIRSVEGHGTVVRLRMTDACGGCD